MITHSQSSHPDWKTKLPSGSGSGSLNFSTFSSCNKQANNIFSWIDWVINERHPFSLVEKERTLKYFKLEPLSRPRIIAVSGFIDKAVEKNLNHASKKWSSWLVDKYEHITLLTSVEMIQRYFELKEIIDVYDDDVKDFIPSATEDARLRASFNTLKDFESSVSKHLLKDTVPISDARARALFNSLLEQFSFLCNHSSFISF